ncbi:hypothetical protein EBZ37_03110, partial [bacterium]|nr:hypothetical protein [bacterium]
RQDIKTSSQLWRFNIRTDSPQELRSKIHHTLQKAGALPSSRFIHGIAVPGGIQFDALVPLEKIENLKEELATFANKKITSGNQQAEPEVERPLPSSPFTWFRNRSKRPLPAGSARVIIWLSLS